MKILSSFDAGTLSKKNTSKMCLTMKEKQAIYKETNFVALFLLEYYLTVIARKNYIITDKKTAIATGLSLRRVEDNRRLLISKNLYYVVKSTDKGTKWIRYCVRKESVYCNKYFDNLFGCNTVRDVYRNFTRKEVEDILVKNNMSQMETKDIKELLE